MTMFDIKPKYWVTRKEDAIQKIKAQSFHGVSKPKAVFSFSPEGLDRAVAAFKRIGNIGVSASVAIMRMGQAMGKTDALINIKWIEKQDAPRCAGRFLNLKKRRYGA